MTNKAQGFRLVGGALSLMFVFLPAGEASAQNAYVLCDNGLRCVMAPCPSTNAYNIRTRRASKVAEVSLGRLTPAARRQVEESGAIYEGSLVLSGVVRQRRMGPAKQPAAMLIVTGVERKARFMERRMCRRR